MSPAVTSLLALAGLVAWGMADHQPGRTARRRWLAALAAAAVVAAAVYPAQRIKDYQFFFGDEMTIVAASMQVAAGAVLYRDVWEFLQPGSFMLLAAVFRLFGDTVAVLDTVALVQFGALTALTFAIVAAHVSMRAAWLTTFALVLVLIPLGVVISPHFMGTAAALGVMVGLLRSRPPGTTAALVLAGFCLGLVFLFQQHKGVYLAAVVVPAYAVACVACGAGLRGTVRGLVRLAAGGMVAALPLVLWLTLHRLWGEWWYATFTWVLEGYAPANASQITLLPLMPGLSAADLLRGLWHQADFTVLRFLPLVYLVAPLTLLGPATGFPRWRVWLVWAVAAGVFGTALTRYDILRLLYTAPTTLVLVACTAARVRSLWPPARRGVGLLVGSTLRGALACVVCIAAAQQLGAHLQFLSTGRHATVSSPRGDVTLWSVGFGDPADARVIITALQGLPRDTGLFVYPTGWGYGYLSGLDNGAPYHIMLPEYSRPKQWTRLFAALEGGAVDVVVWDRTYSPQWMTEVVPTVPPESVWNNPLIDVLQGPDWEAWVETGSVTAFRRVVPPPPVPPA